MARFDGGTTSSDGGGLLLRQVDQHLDMLPRLTPLFFEMNGENSKVVQELLRHASMKVTTDIYMQAVQSAKA